MLEITKTVFLKLLYFLSEERDVKIIRTTMEHNAQIASATIKVINDPDPDIALVKNPTTPITKTTKIMQYAQK